MFHRTGTALFVLLGTALPACAQKTASDGQWIAFSRAGAPSSDLQCFTPANVRVFQGNLILDTKSQASTCGSFDLAPAAHPYTSGFVAMRNFHFLYGTVEFRARFGGGNRSGAWPAVWMADVSCQASDSDGTDDACNEEEIDIAEVLNSDFSHVNQQIHVDHFAYNDGCTASATATDFHVYQLTWSASSLVFQIDGQTTCTLFSHIPKSPMYVKIDVNAGKLGGPVSAASLPWSTWIDYLKVTQGSTVLFQDEFDWKDTVQAADTHTPSAHDRPVSPHPHRIRWIILTGIGIAGATAVLSRQVRRSRAR
jgi:beta-glucanase (GH16 family)